MDLVGSPSRPIHSYESKQLGTQQQSESLHNSVANWSTRLVKEIGVGCEADVTNEAWYIKFVCETDSMLLVWRSLFLGENPHLDSLFIHSILFAPPPLP